eukprot:2580636-Amphidinium_carterae.3
MQPPETLLSCNKLLWLCCGGLPFGRNRDMSLTVLAEQPGLDPTLVRPAMVIGFWHDWLVHNQGPTPLMQQAWTVAMARWQQGLRDEGRVSQLWQALALLGWRCEEWTRWQLHAGQVINQL